jgi:hypothetical protein
MCSRVEVLQNSGIEQSLDPKSFAISHYDKVIGLL